MIMSVACWRAMKTMAFDCAGPTAALALAADFYNLTRFKICDLPNSSQHRNRHNFSFCCPDLGHIYFFGIDMLHNKLLAMTGQQ